MLWNQFYYDGQPIKNITADYYVWIESIKRTEIESQDTKVNIWWYHWVKASPTYIRWRFITIEGGIDCDSRQKSVLWMDYLRNLFALPPITGSTATTKLFKVVDENNRAWQLKVKIDKPLLISDWDDDHLEWTIRKRRIVLFAEDARMLSEIPNIENWEEWNYWWFIMWAELFDQWNYVYKKIICTSVTPTLSPAKITITATADINSKLKVLNLTNLSKFEMNLNAISGDIIVIDSYNTKITKNWVDVTSTRMPWSVRPSVMNVTEFVIYDQDWGLSSSDFNVEIEFYDILI